MSKLLLFLLNYDCSLMLFLNSSDINALLLYYKNSLFKGAFLFTACRKFFSNNVYELLFQMLWIFIFKVLLKTSRLNCLHDLYIFSRGGRVNFQTLLWLIWAYPDQKGRFQNYQTIKTEFLCLLESGQYKLQFGIGNKS